MDIINRVKAFFLSIISPTFQLLPNFNPQLQPPPRSSQNLETPAAESNPQPPSRPFVAGDQNLEWAKIIFAFCFASAIGIAIMSVQTHLQLPPAFYVLSLVISLAFTSQFVAIFIRSKFAAAARVLDQTGVFFAATAFFLAITSPFPTSLMCATWTIYAIALLAILICKYI